MLVIGKITGLDVFDALIFLMQWMSIICLGIPMVVCLFLAAVFITKTVEIRITNFALWLVDITNPDKYK